MTRENLEALRGDTKVFNLTFKTAAGVAIDITGWSIWMTIKTAATDLDASAALQVKVTSHTSPTTGLSKITLTATQTNTLSGAYFYDIQIKKVDGTVETVLLGKINFSDDITRSVA